MGGTTGGVTPPVTPSVTGSVTDSVIGRVTQGVTYPVTGAVTEGMTEAFTGSVSGAVTGSVTEAVSGGVTGGITDSVTGGVTGGVTGSVTQGVLHRALSAARRSHTIRPQAASLSRLEGARSPAPLCLSLWLELEAIASESASLPPDAPESRISGSRPRQGSQKCEVRSRKSRPGLCPRTESSQTCRLHHIA